MERNDGNRRLSRLSAALLIAALPLAPGCNSKKGSGEQPPSEQYDPGSPGDAPSSAEPLFEAKRTREMQEKEAEMKRKLEEAQSGNLTPEELEKAYREYERERLELNRMAEAAETLPDDAAAADYPPPPL